MSAAFLAAATVLLTLRWDTPSGDHMRREPIPVSDIAACYEQAETLAAAFEANGLGANVTVRCNAIEPVVLDRVVPDSAEPGASEWIGPPAGLERSMSWRGSR